MALLLQHDRVALLRDWLYSKLSRPDLQVHSPGTFTEIYKVSSSLTLCRFPKYFPLSFECFVAIIPIIYTHLSLFNPRWKTGHSTLKHGNLICSVKTFSNCFLSLWNITPSATLLKNIRIKPTTGLSSRILSACLRWKTL